MLSQPDFSDSKCSPVALSSRTCAHYVMELGCPVFTVGALLSPSLPSCFPRVFLPLFSPFLPLLSAHARSTHWLTACCAPGLCRCSCYVPTVPFSPCPLRSSVTCCQSPPRPYSCGQQAKRFLDQNTKQALAEFHQSLATLPASHGPAESRVLS